MWTRKADEKNEAMRVAIQDEDYRKMSDLLSHAKYDINWRGQGGDRRTALHTASSCDDKKAISLLMQQKDIDPGILTSKNMSALMIAAANVKLEALEELLSNDRVDVKQRDPEDQTAEDHFKKSTIGTELQRDKARLLFQKARDRGKEVSSVGKMAILIGNKNYQHLSRLDGSWEDLGAMAALLTSSGYTIYEIHDSQDIIEDIGQVMKQIGYSTITHLQLLYAGSLLYHIKTLHIFIQVTGAIGAK